MANRFVRAYPNQQQLGKLRERLESDEIEEMEPFGRTMTRALEKARFDPDTGEAVRIEEDYCSPPLSMERAEVPDDYFEEISIIEEDVEEDAGWQRINDLPGLWEQILDEA